MTFKALIIEDDEDIRRITRTRLKSIGHEADEACSVMEAKAKLEAHEYQYYVLDLGLPLEAGEDPPDRNNGINLLEHIVKAKGPHRVFVVTGSAKEDVYLGVELVKKGALDYICKGHPSKNERTIDQAVKAAIAEGRLKGANAPGEMLPAFPGGEMVLYQDGLTLCGARVPVGMKGPKHGIMRLLFDRQSGKSKEALSEETIAQRLGIENPSGPVRRHIKELVDACTSILSTRYVFGRNDIIGSGPYGYECSKKISIRMVDEPIGGRGEPVTDKTAGPNSETSLTDRQRSLLEILKAPEPPPCAQIAKKLHCSDSTLKRDLRFLRSSGLIGRG